MHSLRLTLAPLALAALAACGGNGVTFSSRVGSPTGTVRPPAGEALTLSNGIVLTRVRIVIQRIQLKVSETTDSQEDGELKVGPYVADFSGAALDSGSPQQLFDAEVPKATYKKIKFKIHKVEDAEATNTALTDMKGKSVVLEGTVDGAAFTFTSSLDEEQERKGTFAIGGGDNLTFNFNPAGWFTKNSARLDPRETTNKSDIEKNIKDSLDCYDDDDHDGKR